MKKSNWIIAAVIALASAFFLGLWYFLGFNLVDNPFDLMLTIVWWVVVAAVCGGISLVEKRRQERVRTVMVGDGCLFNSEAGMVNHGSDDEVSVIEDVLKKLTYGFGVAYFSASRNPKFNFVVRTKKFGATSSGDQVWEGEVVNVKRPNDAPKSFANRTELAGILSAA